jgi:hypothetical protein
VEQLEDRTVPSVTWTGGAGTLNWDAAANWSGGAVPGAADDAVINIAVSGPITISGSDAVHSLTDTTAGLKLTGGSLSLASASSVGKNLTLQGGTLLASGNLSIAGALNQSGGELTGGGTVTVNGLTAWTGGTMTGAGATVADGGLRLGQSGQSDSETLAGRTLINNGTANWYASDTLIQEEASVFQNSAAATLNIQGGTESYNFLAADASGTFVNQGSVVVADGVNPSMFWTSFNNSGKVEVASGTLHLGGPGGNMTGSITVDAGATLQLGANYNYEAYQFGPSSSLGGAGTVDFDSGVAASFASGSTYNVTGTTVINSGGNADANVVFAAGSKVQSVGALNLETGVVNFSTGSPVTLASLTQSDGTLTGSDAVTVSGLTTWTGGQMSGPGSTLLAGGLHLGSTDGAYHIEDVQARTVTNAATATWVGSGEIDLFTGGTFINQTGATFDEKTSDTVWTDIGVGLYPSGEFINRGSFLVDASATAGMQAPFINSGGVEIRSGTWELSGDGTATGTFTVDAGAFFQLNKYYSGGTILGLGTVTKIDGSNTAPTPVTGGAVTIPTKTQSFFRVDGNVTVSSLTMTDGYLVVEGTLTVTGPMVWTGGYIVGPGTIKAEGGLQLGANDGNTGHYEALGGVTLINAGSAVMYDSFSQEFGATFVNQAGATLDLASDGTWSSDGAGSLVNQGTVEKTAGTAKSVIDYVSLFNTGSVAVKSGTLDLEGGGIASGSFTVAAGSTLDFGHGYYAFNSGSSVSGAGTVEFPFNYWSVAFNSGSTYDVSGATVLDQGSVKFLPGSSVKNVGALTLNSYAIDFSTGSPVSVAGVNQLGGVLTGSDTVTVKGLTTWTAGAMSGPGTTVAAGGLQLGKAGDSGDVESLIVRTLVNAGGGTMESKDTFNQFYSSTFQNPAGATLDLQAAVKWQSESDGTAVIDNRGSLTVSAGLDSATVSSYPQVDPFLYNTGNIEVRTGTLDLLRSGDNVGGTYRILAGATLEDGSDSITTSSVAFPAAFTAGDYGATFSGTAADASGTGLASVGVSLYDGSHYWDGTAFGSMTPVFNPAVLTGTGWSYTIPIAAFSSDATYSVQTVAKDNAGNAETSTITTLVLAPGVPRVPSVPIPSPQAPPAPAAPANPPAANNPPPSDTVVPAPAPVTAPNSAPTNTTPPNPGSGQASRDTVANELTHSAEYYTNIVTAAYQKYLGRLPEAAGLAYWVGHMQQGLTDERLEAGFIGSQEYINNHGGTGEAWVRGLYQDLLGRQPRSDEVAYWVNRLNSGTTPQDVAYGFAASAERETQRVAADYVQYLGRSARQDELGYWVNVFLNGADNEQVVAGFISSQESFQESGGDITDWLFAGYNEVLHRTPDAAGGQYFLNQLQ